MNRKTASATLTAFLRTEGKSASVGMMKQLHFKVPKASRATPATIGKRKVNILSWLVATLTDFLRKRSIGKCLVWVA
jgi:hypothetical protein